MNYIVLDLEWNQPASYQSPTFRRIGDKLMFEIIQIGAAKVNEKMEVVDEISILIHPTQYQVIHKRIKRITGITDELLDEAPEFTEAMQKFVDWCGEDAIYVTWGCDDVSVLKQNVDFFNFEMQFPPMYDLQRLYAKQMGISGQVALKTALENLKIEIDDKRTFHNAMHDAYYTAKVLCNLKKPQEILDFQREPRILATNNKNSRFSITHKIKSVKDTFEESVLRSPKCSECKKPSELQTEWIFQAQGKWVAISKCKAHGLLFAKVKFTQLPEDKKGMRLSVVPANKQTIAYVHTKELQQKNRSEQGDVSINYEVLNSAWHSNMPFEEL